MLRGEPIEGFKIHDFGLLLEDDSQLFIRKKDLILTWGHFWVRIENDDGCETIFLDSWKEMKMRSAIAVVVLTMLMILVGGCSDSQGVAGSYFIDVDENEVLHFRNSEYVVHTLFSGAKMEESPYEIKEDRVEIPLKFGGPLILKISDDHSVISGKFEKRGEEYRLMRTSIEQMPRRFKAFLGVGGVKKKKFFDRDDNSVKMGVHRVFEGLDMFMKLRGKYPESLWELVETEVDVPEDMESFPFLEPENLVIEGSGTPVPKNKNDEIDFIFAAPSENAPLEAIPPIVITNPDTVDFWDTYVCGTSEYIEFVEEYDRSDPELKEFFERIGKNP